MTTTPIEYVHHEDRLRQAAELLEQPVDVAKVEAIATQLLTAVGEDVDRPGLAGTPGRVSRAYVELLSGYTADPVALVNDALFEVDTADAVVVRDIAYHSLCEHHMLPFHGHCHVAYLPSRHVLGLSKIPRIVEMFSRRLQIQERLTQQIANFVEAAVQPQGVIVVMEGTHMCASMRGVRKAASMRTRAVTGAFERDPALRREILADLGAR